MHGMVFGELKKFVDKNLKGDSWRNLLKEAGLASRSYIPVKVYPDQELLSLVATASQITGIDKAALLKSFGEFIAPNLLLLFRRQIKPNWNVMDLLERIETTIHNIVRLRNPGAKPPQLRCERVSPQHVIIHYSSSRRLCALGIGLTKGIAEQFGDPYSLEETTCMLHGDDKCQISIKLNIPVAQATAFSQIKLTPSGSLNTSSITNHTEVAPDNPPLVIVGAGPVGIHAAREIVRRSPQQSLIVYGAEPWEPYNRIRLSDLLSGEAEWDEIANNVEHAPNADVFIKINSPITAIDRKNKFVVDGVGNQQHYSKLILALGSRARRADENATVSLSGIFNFRDVDDAQDLMTTVLQSNNTVVTGGGVLGIEVAFALKQQNPDAEVTILHRQDRLMNKQLDEDASAFLLQQVYKRGIKVLLTTTINEFIGQNEISNLKLSDGRMIACDTLISCTGITPNTNLAADAGLYTNVGIMVDDHLLTNDPDVYAVGECAEHRQKTYGLLGPGLEQANIAVANIFKDRQAVYTGTTTSMRVKIKKMPIFAIQKKGVKKNGQKKLIFIDQNAIRFREVTIEKGVLTGAITIGAWDEVAQVQEAVDEGMKIRFWHRHYFTKTGSLWPTENMKNPIEWPEKTMVCTCNAITRGELGAAIRDGCGTVKELSERTGAAQGCGTCAPLLEVLTGGAASAHISAYKGALMICMLLALLPLIGFFLPALNLPTTITDKSFWLPLIFDSGWRQVSGYMAAVFMLLSFVLSLNKRMKWFKFASYNFWRVVHVALLAVTIVVLLAHVNLQLGQGYNLLLMSVFLVTIASGTSLGLLAVMEGGFFGAMIRSTRTFWLRSHIIVVWGLFGLLMTHIISVYYF